MSLRPILYLIHIFATTLVVVAMPFQLPFAGALVAVEICHNDQVITVWLDDQGREHPAPHPCADCALCTIAAGPLPDLWQLTPAPQSPARVAEVFAQDLGTPRPDYLVPHPRGPPQPQHRIASA